MSMPMPNDVNGAGRLIATCIYREIVEDTELGVEEWIVLQLNKTPPFYSLALLTLDKVGRIIERKGLGDFPNIIPATAEYSEWIGGY